MKCFTNFCINFEKEIVDHNYIHIFIHLFIFNSTILGKNFNPSTILELKSRFKNENIKMFIRETKFSFKITLRRNFCHFQYIFNISFKITLHLHLLLSFSIHFQYFF